MRFKHGLLLALVVVAGTSMGCHHPGTGDTGVPDGGSGFSFDTNVDTTIDSSPTLLDDSGAFSGDDSSTDADTGGGSLTDANTDGGGFVAMGQPCTSDASCATGRCVAIRTGFAPICVIPCTSFADCTETGTYCAPGPGGDGVCAPRAEATLCQTCTTDADCGVLNEACVIGTGDTVQACHTDCSLDAIGCPVGYSCDMVGTRHVCSPAGQTCQMAIGCSGSGTCGSDQICCSGSCMPINGPGSCGGCGSSCGRDEGCCGAGMCAPLTTIQNCGMCGNACLGGGETGDAACRTDACVLTCRGEHWDVNGNAADGCELLDSTPPGHTAAAAQAEGSFNACDSVSQHSFSGHIMSDQHAHIPVVTNLDPGTGAAPDYWTVVATGTPTGMDAGANCSQDFSATITTTGGSAAANCYRLTVTGGAATYMTDVSGAGSATVTHAASAYSAGATLTFEIQKTCSSATHEDVTYTISYHL